MGNDSNTLWWYFMGNDSNTLWWYFKGNVGKPLLGLVTPAGCTLSAKTVTHPGCIRHKDLIQNVNVMAYVSIVLEHHEK